MQRYLLLFEKILFFAVIALFIIIPLLPKIPALGVAKTFVSIRYEDFIIALILGLWGVYILISGKLLLLLKERLFQAVLLFWGIGLLSLFCAYFVTHTITGHLGVLHFLRRVEIMSLLPVVLTVVKTKRQVMMILVVLALVTFAVNIYALGQQYLHWPVITTINAELSQGEVLYLTPGARVNSTFAGHYDLAIYSVMVLMVLAPLFLYARGAFLKIAISFLGVLSFVILIMTAARLSFVVAIFGMLIAFLLLGKKRLVLLVVVAAVLVVLYPSPLRDRLVSTVTVNILGNVNRYEAQTEEQNNRSRLNISTLPEPSPSLLLKEGSHSAVPTVDNTTLAPDIVPGEPIDSLELAIHRSSDIRFQVEWPRALRAFTKNPLLGTGYSSITLATDNDYLRMLGETGLLGSAAFVLIMFEIIKRVIKRLRSKDRFVKHIAVGAFVMMISFLLNALLFDVFEASKVAALFWMYTGVVLTLERDDKAHS